MFPKGLLSICRTIPEPCQKISGSRPSVGETMVRVVKSRTGDDISCRWSGRGVRPDVGPGRHDIFPDVPSSFSNSPKPPCNSQLRTKEKPHIDPLTSVRRRDRRTAQGVSHDTWSGWINEWMNDWIIPRAWCWASEPLSPWWRRWEPWSGAWRGAAPRWPCWPVCSVGSSGPWPWKRRPAPGWQGSGDVTSSWKVTDPELEGVKKKKKRCKYKTD